MRALSTILCVFVLFHPTSAQQTNDGIYYLSREGDLIGIRWIEVPEGAELTLPPGAISPILPISIGQSGDVTKEVELSAKVVVRNVGGEIGVDFHRPDGSVRTNPPVSLASVRSYDIRVNVIAGNGNRKAFSISGYKSLEEASGPVIDLFRGMIPLDENDLSTTLVTTPRREEPSAFIQGSAILRYESGLLLTEVTDHQGGTRLFIVDFGAGATVVTKDFLPRDVMVTELTGIERSEKGDRLIKGSMQAAGGDVSSFLGQATLTELRFGEIKVPNVTVNVIEKMPSFGEAQISGIIGIDILQRGKTATFSYESNGRLTLGRAEVAVARSQTIPFTVVGKHIFLEGALEDEKASFLFDTGARFSILSEEMVTRADLPLSDQEARSVKGLDGAPMMARATAPLSIRLADGFIGSAVFSVIDLPVLRGMGLQQDGAILGNDVLSGFSRLEVRFDEQKLIVWK